MWDGLSPPFAGPGRAGINFQTISKMAGEALSALLTVPVQGVAYHWISLGSGLNFIDFNRFALE
jgi:hypothetical protein